MSQGAITSYTFSNVTANHTISATFTGISNGNSYEAENAILSGGANKNTNHANYSGTGFVDGFYNSTTAQVSFTVNVTSSGSYTLTLRYSAGNGTSTNTGLSVNGTNIKNIICSATANWDTWANETETVTLMPAIIRLRIRPLRRIQPALISISLPFCTANGCTPPTITGPTSQTVCPGNSTTLSISAPGATSYQWYSGNPGSGTAISGATTASYVTSPINGTVLFVVANSNDVRQLFSPPP